MKRILKMLAWVGLFIWQILQNLVALIMMPFVGIKEVKCIKRYCWCIIAKRNMQGSISLGNFVFLYDDSNTTCAHELGHVKDSHWMGPLYLFIIGIPSIIWAGFDIAAKRGVSYYSFYPEKRANKNSHIHDYKPFPNIKYWRLAWDEGYSLDDIK